MALTKEQQIAVDILRPFELKIKTELQHTHPKGDVYVVTIRQKLEGLMLQFAELSLKAFSESGHLERKGRATLEKPQTDYHSYLMREQELRVLARHVNFPGSESFRKRTHN